MTATSEHAPRIAPRVWLGLLTYAIYLAVFFTVWIVNGIDYPRIGDNEGTLLKWYLIPLLAGTIPLVIIVLIFGWWRPALFETRKRVSGWVWILPGLLALAAIGSLIFGDSSRMTATMWIILAAGSILVGFNEEMLTRGQLIVALRSRFGELGVWFLSTLLFGLRTCRTRSSAPASPVSPRSASPS
jgi:membrane protease YdiL (CAAX protease family)